MYAIISNNKSRSQLNLIIFNKSSSPQRPTITINQLSSADNLKLFSFNDLHNLQLTSTFPHITLPFDLELAPRSANLLVIPMSSN